VTDTYTDDPALYSIVYSDLSGDIEPLTRLMASAGAPVLELCCGNGRVLLPALLSGVDVDGLDISEPMLEDLRARLTKQGIHTGIYRADMRAFSLPRRYGMVLIAFNSFLHNLTQSDQLATLRCCREHLTPDGRLELIAFHPDVAKLVEYSAGEVMIKEIPDPAGAGRVRVLDVTTDDRIDQVRNISRRIEFVDDSGAITRTKHWSFQLRYVFKPEMELLLRAAGFARWMIRPLEFTGDGRAAFVEREPREGEVLLWTAWSR
jgi:SAM-dependent methyltransferase